MSTTNETAPIPALTPEERDAAMSWAEAYATSPTFSTLTTGKMARLIFEQAATIEGLEDMVLAYRTTTDNNPDALVRDVEWPNDFEMIAEIAMRRALSEETGNG